MTLTPSGSAISATTSVTLPTHNIGDLIVILASRQSNATAPSVPSAAGTVPAWTTIDTLSGATAGSLVTAYFVATATNHTSGTWANATGMVAVVVPGAASSPIGGHATNNGNNSSTNAGPSVTQVNTDGSSLLLYFYGHNTPLTAWGSAPAGYTRLQATTASFLCCNTKDDTTSDGSASQPLTSSSAGNAAAVVEILAKQSSAFFALL